MDREKVIKGLECIIWEVDHNSMWLPGDDDIRDAIVLLKEQEAETIECEMCGHRLQTDWNWCPWCRWEIARRSVKLK